MSRWIDIDDERNVYCGMDGEYEKYNIDTDVLFEALPSVQPERKKGKWVGSKEYCDHLNEEAKRKGRTERYIPSGMNIGVYCDQCWGISTQKSDYCPNCGADMRGEVKND